MKAIRTRQGLLRDAWLSEVGHLRPGVKKGLPIEEAQKAAAKLEPKVAALHDTLKLGEADRKQETSLRWQAGYDLAIGRVMAVRVRTEAYNAMLAKAKRGMKFKNEKNAFAWSYIRVEFAAASLVFCVQ